jgi:hypothetical protein
VVLNTFADEFSTSIAFTPPDCKSCEIFVAKGIVLSEPTELPHKRWRLAAVRSGAVARSMIPSSGGA